MKTYTKAFYTIASLAIIFSVGSSSAFAETPILGPRQQFKEDRREIRQDIKNNRKEIRADRKENRQARRDLRAQKHGERLEARFGHYYTRLTAIATKIQERINKLKGEGRDITTAQTKLDEAKAKLESAKSLGAEAVAAFKAIDPAKYQEQRAAALAARDKAKQARQAFQDAHKLLKEAVKIIKAL